MWQLDNQTPFAAERGWLRDRDGSEVWLVAVKATFDVLADGSTAVAGEQPPVLRLPQHHGQPGASSIRYDADLVLRKHNTDVIVVGHAHAPPGTSVTQLDCGFRVGPVQKVLRVFGDRTWGPGGHSAPQRFTRLPLVYERAYGGRDAASPQPERDWDARNPVGAGFITATGHADGVRLPNLEDPQAPVSSWKDRPDPAGFGALATHWQPRAAWAGTYGDAWQQTRAPLLAEDLDERWFQSAPADQQAAGFLRGGEDVVLLNLHPRGRITFTLPKLHLGFETRFSDGSRQIHANRCLHTVILEPDFPRVSLVWHSALPCHHKVQQLQRTLLTLKADRSAHAAALEAPAGAVPT